MTTEKTKKSKQEEVKVNTISSYMVSTNKCQVLLQTNTVQIVPKDIEMNIL